MRRAASRSARQHRRRFARQPKYKIQILIKYKIQILTKYKIQILTKYEIQILRKYKTQISTKYKIQIFICKKTGLPDDQRGGVYNRPGPQVYHLLQVLSLVVPVFHFLQIPKKDDISTKKYVTGHSVQPHRRENATPSMTPSTSRRYPTSLSAQLWIVTINNYHLISSACLSVSWMKNTSFPQCETVNKQKCTTVNEEVSST